MKIKILKLISPSIIVFGKLIKEGDVVDLEGITKDDIIQKMAEKQANFCFVDKEIEREEKHKEIIKNKKDTEEDKTDKLIRKIQEKIKKL